MSPELRKALDTLEWASKTLAREPGRHEYVSLVTADVAREVREWVRSWRSW